MTAVSMAARAAPGPWALLFVAAAFCACGADSPVESGLPTATIDSPSRDTSILLGASVVFSGSRSGSIVSLVWDFGDGQGASVEDPGAHTYASAASYPVSFTVTDDLGRTASAGRVVTVAPASGENFALRFEGNGVDDIDRVKIPVDDPTSAAGGPPADIGSGDVTIEFWMRATVDENRATVNTGAVCNSGATGTGWVDGNIVIDRDRKNANRSYGVALSDGRLVWGISGPNSQYTQCGRRDVADDAWHHIALVREAVTGVMAMYVDGELDIEAITDVTGDFSYPDDYSTSNPESDPFLVLGAEKHDLDATRYPPFTGYLDELRLSTTVRYRGASFTVPGRLGADEWTAGLYHFDEGTGDLVGDSSGAAGGPSTGVRRFGGTPPGPRWVLSGAPTGG